MSEWRSVFHFDLNRTSFVLTFLVIMVLARLVFFVFDRCGRWLSALSLATIPENLRYGARRRNILDSTDAEDLAGAIEV
jgi:hypothetical protein